MLMRTCKANVVVVALASLCCIGAASAVEPGERLADPALEARARGLSTELRCLVCQNQSIDDSNAPLARDLRMLVRERLTAGDSDKDVRAFVVARYGDFVLLKPPFNLNTLLLWLTPLLVLGGIAALIVPKMRRSSVRSSNQESQPLTAEEEAQLERLLRLQTSTETPKTKL